MVIWEMNFDGSKTQPSRRQKLLTGRLLMQGKARQCAGEVRLQAHEVDAVLAQPPPLLELNQAKLADAKWFSKRWLVAHSKGDPSSRHCRAPGLSNAGLLQSELTFFLEIFLQPCCFLAVRSSSAYRHALASPPPRPLLPSG